MINKFISTCVLSVALLTSQSTAFAANKKRDGKIIKSSMVVSYEETCPVKSTNKAAGTVLATAVGGIIIREGIQGISRFTERRLEKQMSIYVASTNTEILRKNSKKKIIGCIIAERKFRLKKDDRELDALRGSYFEFELQKYTSNALVLKPVYASIPYAAAETGKGKPVNVSATIRIDHITGEKKLETVANQTLDLGEIHIGEIPPKRSNFKTKASNVFVLPKDLSGPATIAVSITELGSKTEKLRKRNAFITRNRATVQTALEGLLGEIIPGGD